MKRTVAQWTRTRSRLKSQFDKWGIRHCEVCGSTFALSFAHRYKRRFINDEQELSMVALICMPCHERIEHSGHANMYERITAIIENRST